ncbi:MAG TPA: zinc ribbon domain-containing protein [Methanomassiliicoccales archaeon]|jgi:hypothetical protein|nr:zinc ribbon domain-containing protein [Methanomassiliicoccales archaeon]
MAAPNQQAQKTYFCEHCGEYLPPEAKVCPKCGYPVGGYPAGQAPPASRFLSTARTASFLFLVSGLDGLLSAIYLLYNLDLLVQEFMSMYSTYSADQIRAAYLILIGFFFVASILTLVAFYYARQRRHFRLVAVCGFFSLFTLGLIFLEASFLGLLGLIATFRARREFH